MGDTCASPAAAAADFRRLAIVTGGNKGIGYCIAEQLVSAGMRVVIACRNEELARQAARSLGVEYGILDLADGASIESFAAVVSERYGYLDVLVNNGALAFKGSDPTPFQQQTEPTLRTNYYGTVALTDSLLPLLRASAAAGRSPRIVNVASMAGKLGQLQPHLQKKFTSPDLDRPTLNSLVERFARDVQAGTHQAEGWGNSNYGMSKLSLIAYTGLVAREEGAAMRVNSCCPGYCDTDMTSHRGPRPPQDGARTASMLALLPDDGPTGAFFKDEVVAPW